MTGRIPGFPLPLWEGVRGRGANPRFVPQIGAFPLFRERAANPDPVCLHAPLPPSPSREGRGSLVAASRSRPAPRPSPSREGRGSLVVMP
jgi:hypothetical protein